MASLDRRGFLKGVGATAAGVVAGLGAPAIGQPGGASERLGVGLIGCGGRMGAHIGALQGLKNEGFPVEIVAAMDVYQKRLDAVVQATGARPYRDHLELLADPRVDLVCIASPDRHHGPQAIDAVNAGKDVYSEKPLVHWQQFEVLKALTHLAEEKGAVVQVGTQCVADSIWRQARELIQEGAIGKINHVQVGYFRQGDWGERGMPILDPNVTPGADLDWDKFLGDAPKRPFTPQRFFCWRMFLDYAGGPPTDLYPHVLTPIAVALDMGFPTRAMGAGGKLFYNHEREVPDTANILADFPEGYTLALLGTQVNARGLETCIRGSEATLTFEGPGIRLYPADGNGTSSREVVREQRGDLRELWVNFLDCVKTRKRPWSDVRLQYYVQTVINMGMLSLMNGRMAHFDAKRERIRLED